MHPPSWSFVARHQTWYLHLHACYVHNEPDRLSIPSISEKRFSHVPASSDICEAAISFLACKLDLNGPGWLFAATWAMEIVIVGRSLSQSAIENMMLEFEDRVAARHGPLRQAKPPVWTACAALAPRSGCQTAGKYAEAALRLSQPRASSRAIVAAMAVSSKCGKARDPHNCCFRLGCWLCLG